VESLTPFIRILKGEQLPMKKLALVGLVVVLLAVAVVPVLAAGGNNGHGNGQGRSGGDQNQTSQQDQTQFKNNGRAKSGNMGANRNQAGLHMRNPFYVQGTIKSIDTGNNTLTVTVFHANAKAKQVIGKDLVVTVLNPDAIFKVNQGEDTEGAPSTSPSASSTDDGSSARQTISLAELKANDIVAIHGNVVSAPTVAGTDANTAGNTTTVATVVYNATMITVYEKLAGIQPETETP
jgi:hypothetical protein